MCGSIMACTQMRFWAMSSVLFPMERPHPQGWRFTMQLGRRDDEATPLEEREGKYWLPQPKRTSKHDWDLLDAILATTATPSADLNSPRSRPFLILSMFNPLNQGSTMLQLSEVAKLKTQIHAARKCGMWPVGRVLGNPVWSRSWQTSV